MINLSYMNKDPSFEWLPVLYIENKAHVQTPDDHPRISAIIVKLNCDSDEKPFHAYTWNQMQGFEDCQQPDDDTRVDTFDEAFNRVKELMGFEGELDAPNQAVLNDFQKVYPAQAKADKEHLTVADYKEVIEDHKRLVRELDRILNGDNAAGQASLIDIIKQLEKGTQRVWLLKDSSGEFVMMCPTKPTEDFVARTEDKIQKLISVEEFLLIKQ